ARARRHTAGRAGRVAAGRRDGALVGPAAAVAVGRPPDRPRRGAERRVGAGQGDGHPVRAGRACRGPAPGRPGAVARHAVGVRAAARPGDPDRAVVHDPRRHERGAALGRRAGAPAVTDALLLEVADRVLADTCTHEAIQAAERDGWAPGVWAAVAEVGLHRVALEEGGTLGDALAGLRLAGRHAAPVPRAATGRLARGVLVARGGGGGGGVGGGGGGGAVVPGRPEDRLAVEGDRLLGVAHRVPWARAAERVVALVASGDRWLVASAPAPALTVEPLVNL